MEKVYVVIEYDGMDFAVVGAASTHAKANAIVEDPKRTVLGDEYPTARTIHTLEVEE